MGEHKFTKYFKTNLADQLNKTFEKYNYELQAFPEHSVPTIYGTNAIDIGIVGDDPNKIVGIEIEYISNPTQIKLNRDKFRNWVHKTNNRSGGLLHIICDDTNISMSQLSDLLISSHLQIAKGLNFFYEFFALKDFSKKETLNTAINLVDSDWEFEVRLFSLINNVFR